MNYYNNYLEYVARWCHVPVEEICNLPQKRIINDYILPRGLGKSGTELRQHGIPDEFMMFMAKYGRYCYDIEFETGEVLYWLALHRIEHRAIPCNLNPDVPQEYRDYLMTDNEPQYVMTPACWEFLRDQMPHMLRFEETQDAARRIVFTILDNITMDGHLGALIIPYRNVGIPDPRDLFSWAKRCAISERQLIPIMLVRKHFAQPDLWQHYLWFWHDQWPKIYDTEKKWFYDRAGISGWWQQFKVNRTIKNYCPPQLQ